MASSSIDSERLVASLTDAIQTGNASLAKEFVTHVSIRRLKLDIKIGPTGYSSQQQTEKEFNVNVHMEDKQSSGVNFQIAVKSSDSITDLKRKVFIKHNIPIDLQRWIIGKRIPADDVTIGQCGVASPGHTLFLYIVTIPPVLGELDEEYEQCRNDYTNNSDNCMMSPPIMSNNMSFMGYGKQSEVLLMNPNLKTRNSQPREPKPPPIPARIPIQNEFNDIEETKVVTVPPNPLFQVIPAPSQLEQPPQMKPQQGWECPACTFLNLPTRPGCEMCATGRPEHYVVPDNYEMTDQEVALMTQQDELERLTRQNHEATLRDNFNQWLILDDQDLITNTEAFTCPICFDDFQPGEGIMLRDCLHSFCRECLEAAVTHTEDPILTCPYQDDNFTCASVLQEREVRALVPEEIFIKYLQRGLDQAESQAANSFHCKTKDCKGWCIYEDEVNFFLCPICKKQNCLTCKVIHEGMNCKEYQADLASKAINDDAARQTQKLIQEMVANGTAMNCPQCKIIVQKKDGCDWIKCSVCKTEICWVTKGPRWGPKGSGDTSGGCRCGLNGKRCHAACGNCH